MDVAAAGMAVETAARAAKPVVVVELGSTGSALAARLSSLGHDVVGIEQFAHTVQGRVYDVAPSTVDMLSKWGIADDVLHDLAGGGDAARATSDLHALVDGITGVDPRGWLHVRKDAIDAALRGVAERSGARLLTGTTFERAEHAADGSVRVYASGLDDPIEGSMLVFADGGRDASTAAIGHGYEAVPGRARYVGGWLNSGMSSHVATRSAAERAQQGFAYAPGDGTSLVWARVPKSHPRLASPSAGDVREDAALADEAAQLVSSRAREHGVTGTPHDMAVADVRLRIADHLVGPHGEIGLGDLVAGVPFDRSQGFNAGVLEADRAARHVQDVLAPGADRAALEASYERDVLGGARELVEQSRIALG